MTRSKNLLTLLAAAVLLVCGTGLQAQDPSDAQVEFMKNWEAYMKPGPAHEVLKSRVGAWTLNLKIWMAPDAPPMESEAKSTLRLIMDGRFLIDHTEGEFDGDAFRGLGIVGYDNFKKKYVSMWLDNHGTGIMQAEGTYNAETKTFEHFGVAPDLMTGKTKKTRAVERTISKDEFVVQMFETPAGGKEHKAMEISYRRAKGNERE